MHVLFSGLVLFCLVLLPTSAHSKKEHIVYFSNTAYELNIYKIYGKNSGKTLMLIGGIQGNEPGGFLSADLYADMSLKKGNLIVVPRANFYSIILNQRGANGDMNRKFTHEDNTLSMEDRIVTILKGLISESDYLLNLHDGSGYYYPEYIDKWRNPDCFGQAIIADCNEYRIEKDNRVIHLEKMAQKVIEKVNLHIKNDLHKFHFMNTRTGQETSRHKEQRKSATYYALTRHHIPAFGVETSKFLPSIDLKVSYHNLVINEFMEMFEIIPESPGMELDAPVLKYVVVSINGETSIVVNKDQELNILKGDSINVSHIESNYERGLSLDILGCGDLNDFRKSFKIDKGTSMIVRKDNHKFAEIPINITERRVSRLNNVRTIKEIDYIAIELGGKKLLLEDGESLEVVEGEKMKIIDVFPSGMEGVTVNFKGFVGDKKNNTGEDRGYEIDTAKDLMKRYSVDRKGLSYPIVVMMDDAVLGQFIIKIVPPRVN